MKYYIIAGEASGDLHGSNLMKAIKELDNNAKFRFSGGDLMQAESHEGLALHYRDTDFMGFIEVVQNLGKIFSNFKIIKNDIQTFQPDKIILIDYPGFNLRMAKWAKRLSYEVIYYISPQVWAWKSARVKTIKKYVDQMLVILPFEQDFYKKYNYDVHFVGHPLLDAINDYQKKNHFLEENNLDNRPIIALLPGSRSQEIRKHLKKMLQLAPRFSNYQFVIAGAPSISMKTYQSFLEDYNDQSQKNENSLTQISIVKNKTYDLLQHSHAAIVASGTATLETALFNIPQVVCYKGSAISYEIAKRIVKIKYISLVNLIMDKPILKELIQYDFTVDKIQNELTKILEGKRRQEILKNYSKLHSKLGGGGASDNAAKLIITSSQA